MRRLAIQSLLMLTLATLVTGCGPTYVNIPPQPGDVASHNPNSARVRNLLTAAFQHVIDQGNYAGPIALNLPETTTALTHAAVADAISNALGPDEEGSPAVTLNAIQVRIRGTRAGVDIRRPIEGQTSDSELVTVNAKMSGLNNWNVTGVRVWGDLDDDR